MVYFWCNIFWLLAGFVAGVASFGGNLVAVPFNTLVVEPRIAILSGCISGTAVFLGLCLFYWRHILWKETVYLLCGATAGIPIGIAFLRSAGGPAILLAAGVALMCFLGWQLFSGRLGARKTPMVIWLAFPFGCVSGIMMAAVGMGGPPLVLYAYLRQWGKEAILGTVNAASLAFMLVVLPWQYFSALYSSFILELGLQGALAAFAGICLSIPVVSRINLGLFRKLLLFMLFLSACMLLVRAFS